MRTMLKMTLGLEAGNNAIKNGSIGKILGHLQEQLKPEAAYFGADDGERTAFFVFDLKDPSQIPVLAEPLFMELNAKVQFIPIMNIDELKGGLEQLAKNAGKQLAAAH